MGIEQKPKNFGKYEIIRELGSGNMGRVLLVHDPDRNIQLALKIMLAGEHADQKQEDRFFAETSAMQRLKHPNIVQIYDVGKHNGINFFTMECVDGVDLDDFLKSRKISSRRAVEIFIKIAQAIQHAHEKNILHRDIKPGNIILRNAKDPLVTDFGLARSTREASRITQTGALLGTPAFMAPEQARGKTKEIDERTDIYALGVTLYKMLTRQLPFNASTSLATLQKVVNTTPTPVRKINPLIPQDLENICMKAIEKKKEHRFSSVKEMIEDLERFLDGVSVSTPQSSPRLKNLRASISQYKVHLFLGALLLISLLGHVYTLQGQSNVKSQKLFSKQDVQIISPSFLKKESFDAIPSSVYEMKLEVKLPSDIIEIHTQGKRIPWNKPKTNFKTNVPLVYGENLIDITFLDKFERYYKLRRKVERKKAKGSFLFHDNVERLSKAKTYSITPLKLKWKFSMKNSEITFTPLVLNNRIFFGSRNSFFYCVNDKGQLVWKFESSAPIAGYGTISEGVVYFGNNYGDVYGLDIHSGNQLFFYRTKQPQRFSPLIRENTIYLNTDEENFYAIDLETAQKKWHFVGEKGDELYSSPSFYKQTIIIPEYSGKVYALDCKNGDVLWKKKINPHNFGSPIVIDDTVYIVFDGIFCAFNAKNGELLWDCKLEGEIVSTGILYGYSVLITNTKGILHSVDLTKRKVVSKIKTSPLDHGAKMWSSPTMAGEDVFLNSLQYFYSINIKTKEITIHHKTEYTKKHYTYSSPVIHGKSIYVGSTDGVLYAYKGK